MSSRAPPACLREGVPLNAQSTPPRWRRCRPWSRHRSGGLDRRENGACDLRARDVAVVLDERIGVQVVHLAGPKSKRRLPRPSARRPSPGSSARRCGRCRRTCRSCHRARGDLAGDQRCERIGNPHRRVVRRAGDHGRADDPALRRRRAGRSRSARAVPVLREAVVREGGLQEAERLHCDRGCRRLRGAAAETRRPPKLWPTRWRRRSGFAARIRRRSGCHPGRSRPSRALLHLVVGREVEQIARRGADAR